MIILIIQFVIFAFGVLCLYCEASSKYRDCKLHIFIRGVLMALAVIVFCKIPVFATSPIWMQFLLLFTVCATARLLYKKVLRKQLRIKNFKLFKLYLGETKWQEN